MFLYISPIISLSNPSKTLTHHSLWFNSFHKDFQDIGFFNPSIVSVILFPLKLIVTAFLLPSGHTCTFVEKSKFVVVLQFNNFLIGLIQYDVGNSIVDALFLNPHHLLSVACVKF
jgi:hypothetical protein